MMKKTVVRTGATLVTAVALSLSFAGSALATGPTADQEDPTCAPTPCVAVANGYLVGMGSDTTQDVVYGLSQDLGTESNSTQQALQSWTATGTANFLSRSGVTVVASAPATGQALRPNGSKAGYQALLDSIGATSGVSGFNIGDVDYSRASGTQGVQQSGSTGVTTDIPFAIDALGVAVPTGSPFLSTNGGNGLSIGDITKIYSGQVNEVNTTTGALALSASATTPDSGSEFIQAFVPKPGSGSRQFFVKQLASQDPTDINLAAGGQTKGDGLWPATTAAPDGLPYIGSYDYAAAKVQEHDASVLIASETHHVAAIAPFSAAKFIGYHNGLIADPSNKVAGTDYQMVKFASTVAGAPATGVLPYVDNSGTYAPSQNYASYAKQGTEANSFTLTREVYNIIPTQAWLHPYASVKNRALVDTFVGKGSKVCLDVNTIKAYGFLPDTTNCGSTAKTFGSSVNNNGYSPVSITEGNTAAVAGQSTKVTFTVNSIGNGGGTLSVTIGGTVYNGTVAPGANKTVSFTVPTPTAGSLSYGGGANDGFTPNLAGVAQTAAPTGTITVAKATPIVKAVAPAVSHLRIGSVTVYVSATGLVPTGTVAIQVKTTTGVLKVSLTGKALSGGKVTASLGKLLPRGTYYVYVSYSGNANVNAKALTRLATLSVS